jgi:hypothetical protein
VKSYDSFTKETELPLNKAGSAYLRLSTCLRYYRASSGGLQTQG